MRKDKMFEKSGSRPWQLRWWKEEPERWRWAGTIAVVLVLIGVFTYQNPQIWQNQAADLDADLNSSILAEVEPPPGIFDIADELTEPGDQDLLESPPLTGEDQEPGDQPLADPAEQDAEPQQQQEPVVSVAAAPASWQAPVAGSLSRSFGYGQDPTLGDFRFHTGYDITAEANAPVFAAADGKVVQAGEDALWGGIVVIEHGGGWQTSYRCLSPLVQSGAEVVMGDQIGSVLATSTAEAAQSTHLHFEMALEGAAQNPADWL